MKIQSIFCYIFFVLLGYVVFLIPMGCANPVTVLSGGTKDIQPPRIDSLKSTPNPSLNFNEKEIEITFDEWIKLEDAFNQVVVSPPLDNKLDVNLKKKTVIVTIDERDSLKDNTTYIINFGNSVKDLTEGNIPSNLKFVFSTGPKIDSLSLKGQAFDLETGKGLENVLVMLYKNLEDSIVRTEKPYYFAKTDVTGNFKLEYLKEGTYKAFALVDNNYNYLFDLPNEKIGFMEDSIVITDSSSLDLSFKLFEEEPPLIIMDQGMRQQGVIKLLFNKKPNEIQVDLIDAFEDSYIDFAKDTMLIWYAETDSSVQRTIRLSLEKEDFTDTLEFTIPVKKKGLPFKIISKSKSIQLSPLDSFVLEFNLPIGNIDTSLISILVDSLPYTGKKYFFVGANPRLVQLDFDRTEEKKYEFSILPNAITDIFGEGLDSIEKTVSILPLSEFGDINLNLILPDSSIQYIVQLLGANGKELDEFTVANVSSFKKTYKTLSSGNYQIKVIEDINANGRRDSGDYDEKRQPERIFQKQLEELRKNWELESEVSVVF
ncbi:MAG: hypothetical protein ACI94Y_001414 [Maribacter sp.]|jgi:hypothetical protein